MILEPIIIILINLRNVNLVKFKIKFFKTHDVMSTFQTLNLKNLKL